MSQNTAAGAGRPPDTWEDDIKAFFTQLDVGCMRRFGLDLGDYETVKARAPEIHERVAEGSMPAGGPAWVAEKVKRFKDWTDDGCPKGPRPPPSAASGESTQERAR